MAPLSSLPNLKWQKVHGSVPLLARLPPTVSRGVGTVDKLTLAVEHLPVRLEVSLLKRSFAVFRVTAGRRTEGARLECAGARARSARQRETPRKSARDAEQGSRGPFGALNAHEPRSHQ
ncbi:hypothetical protein NDU88_006493 [Pleurodeles waltl]|uniref:Uncharacterized protein n=1 Tax=Pleurodeles waltl TaxID=8319 RepID=A0AAV7N474_PLEWA|nr:hypothetical protein NDU88_006493 [Pleurodeles waltl]